jgi:DNA-binding transcriptional regulator LsrR (DeoR family)
MKLTKTQIAKDLFFNDNLTTSIIADRLKVSQSWVCKAINS